MNVVAENLIAARKLIENEKHWGKGPRFDRFDRRSFCMAEAVEQVTAFRHDERRATFSALRNQIGGESVKVVDWNDTHEHADVLAAFDHAIAEASS